MRCGCQPGIAAVSQDSEGRQDGEGRAACISGRVYVVLVSIAVLVQQFVGNMCSTRRPRGAHASELHDMLTGTALELMSLAHVTWVLLACRMCYSQAQGRALGSRLPGPAIAACSQLAAGSQRACLRLAASSGPAASMQADDACDNANKRARYKRIDEEEDTGFLGKGTFGRVYIAEDTCTGDVVAVKRQKYPSKEATKELAFAMILASNPSVQR